MELTLLTKRRVLMLGFGVEQQAFARWLLSQGVRLTVRTTDRSISVEPFGDSVLLEHTDQPLQKLSEFDVVLRPSVLASTHPALQRFEKEGGTVLTALHVLLSRCPARTIGVLGSRGKTTTAAAIEQLLRLTYQQGTTIAASVAESFEHLNALGESDLLILPLSDAEGQGAEVAPTYLVPLAGAAAASALAAAQRPTDVLFLGMHHEGAAMLRQSAGGRIRELHGSLPRREAAWIAQLETGKVLFWERSGALYSFRLPATQRGEAFTEALAYAALLADELGVGHEHIQAHLPQVSTAPHRLQVIATHREVLFVDDAAASDTIARTHALRAYADVRVHLITDPSSLIEALPANLATLTLLPGADQKLTRAWERLGTKAGVEVLLLAQQPTCLRQAFAQLSTRFQQGDVVLFSPGARAQKPFRSVDERGAAYLEAVHLYASQA